jgi:hypothetical protein
VTASDAALPKLVEACNEGDESLRRALLDECWDDEGRLLENGQTVVQGRAALERYIEGLREDPEFFLTLTNPVQRSGKLEWARWRIRGLHESVVPQEVVAHLSAEDRLREVKAATADTPPEGGKLGARLQEAAIANPIPATGLLGGVLYLALRVPVGLFYGDLGITPDEVGFGPEVLVPQSLTLLLAFILAMACLYGVGLISVPPLRAYLAVLRLRKRGQKARARLVMCGLGLGVIIGYACVFALAALDLVPVHVVAYFGVLLVVVAVAAVALVVLRLPWLADDVVELKDQARRGGVARERVKNLMWLFVFYGAFGLLVALPIWALVDANRVRRGGTAGGRMTPWRALPVELRFTRDARVQLNNRCEVLRLLGVGNGQIVVFDTRLDRVFRIPVAHASASVKRDCST